MIHGWPIHTWTFTSQFGLTQGVGHKQPMIAWVVGYNVTRNVGIILNNRGYIIHLLGICTHRLFFPGKTPPHPMFKLQCDGYQNGYVNHWSPENRYRHTSTTINPSFPVVIHFNSRSNTMSHSHQNQPLVNLCWLILTHLAIIRHPKIVSLLPNDLPKARNSNEVIRSHGEFPGPIPMQCPLDFCGP